MAKYNREIPLQSIKHTYGAFFNDATEPSILQTLQSTQPQQQTG